jgi:hypothetical protein
MVVWIIRQFKLLLKIERLLLRAGEVLVFNESACMVLDVNKFAIT